MPEGLLLVDKSPGWTSHDAVAALRRFFPKGTKVGHSGTLDPMATGLLVLMVGPATRAAARLQGLSKVYSGTLRLGVETASGDLEGGVLKESPLPPVDETALQSAFDAFRGEVETPVPAYSAVKHQGRPLYEYARKGIEVPPKTRKVTVSDWRLLSWAPPEASFRLSCSSGTYVRSLAVLVGKAFGCGAALSSLRRERVGPFRVEDSRTVDSLRALAASEGFDRVLLPVPDAPLAR